MNYRIQFITISTLIIAACNTTGTKKELSVDQLRYRLQSGQVEVEPVSKPAVLVERTKSRAIGNMLISSIVSSAAGSAGHASSPQQFNENVEFGQTLGQEIHQALPEGSKVKSGNGIDRILAGKLADYFSGQAAAKKRDGGKTIAISVKANLWELGYISMLASSNYQLNYDLRLLVQEKAGEKGQLLKEVTCRGEAPGKMPLAQWQAENYLKVDTAAKQIADRCFTLALSEMGLNN